MQLQNVPPGLLREKPKPVSLSNPPSSHSEPFTIQEHNKRGFCIKGLNIEKKDLCFKNNVDDCKKEGGILFFKFREIQDFAIFYQTINSTIDLSLELLEKEENAKSDFKIRIKNALNNERVQFKLHFANNTTSYESEIITAKKSPSSKSKNTNKKRTSSDLFNDEELDSNTSNKRIKSSSKSDEELERPNSEIRLPFGSPNENNTNLQSYAPPVQNTLNLIPSTLNIPIELSPNHLKVGTLVEVLITFCEMECRHCSVVLEKDKYPIKEIAKTFVIFDAPVCHFSTVVEVCLEFLQNGVAFRTRTSQLYYYDVPQFSPKGVSHLNLLGNLDFAFPLVNDSTGSLVPKNQHDSLFNGLSSPNSSVEETLARLIKEKKIKSPEEYQKVNHPSSGVVCYVELNGICASGFVLRREWIVTNNHVIPSKESALQAKFSLFLEGKTTNLKPRIDYDDWFFTNSEFDFSFIRINEQKQIPVVCIVETKKPNIFLGCKIVGFPLSHPVPMVIELSKVTSISSHEIEYESTTSTFNGMSGSPIFNRDGFVIGIHQRFYQNKNYGIKASFMIKVIRRSINRVATDSVIKAEIRNSVFKMFVPLQTLLENLQEPKVFTERKNASRLDLKENIKAPLQIELKVSEKGEAMNTEMPFTEQYELLLEGAKRNDPHSTRYTCDSCDKLIFGNRYNCEICPNFDFCEECKNTKQHDHPMKKIPTKPLLNLEEILTIYRIKYNETFSIVTKLLQENFLTFEEFTNINTQFEEVISLFPFPHVAVRDILFLLLVLAIKIAHDENTRSLKLDIVSNLFERCKNIDSLVTSVDGDYTSTLLGYFDNYLKERNPPEIALKRAYVGAFADDLSHKFGVTLNSFRHLGMFTEGHALLNLVEKLVPEALNDTIVADFLFSYGEITGSSADLRKAVQIFESGPITPAARPMFIAALLETAKLFKDSDYLHVWLMKIENIVKQEELLKGMKRNAFLYVMLLNRSGQYEKAKNFYNRIEISQNDSPIDHVDILLAGASLASSGAAKVEFYLKAISKLEKMLSFNPEDQRLLYKYNITLFNTASSYFTQNNYEISRNYLKKSLEKAQYLGLVVQIKLHNKDNWEEIMQYLRNLVAFYKSASIEEMLEYSSVEQAFKTPDGFFDLLYEVIFTSQSQSIIMETIGFLIEHSMLHSIQLERNFYFQEQYFRSEANLALTDARLRISKLLLRGPDGSKEERLQWMKDLQELTFLANDKEVELWKSLPVHLHPKAKTIDELAAIIPNDIVFVLYDSQDLSRNIYTGIVFTKSSLSSNLPFRIYQIGDIKKIDDLIESFLSNLGVSRSSAKGNRPVSTKGELVLFSFVTFHDLLNSWNQSECIEDGSTLTALLIQPIKKFFPEYKKITIIPSNKIALLPFAALPACTNEFKFLIQEYSINYAISLGELFKFYPATDPMVVHSGLFNVNSNKNARVFRPLNDEEEGKAVTDQLKSYCGKVTVLKGGDATKPNFMAECRSPIILHISSHGYFLKSPPNEDSFMKAVNNETNFKRLTSEFTLSPLIRSGIALTAADNFAQGEEINSIFEEGVLTAFELLTMNLHHSELVTLSLCNGAVGDSSVRSVQGIRGAFRFAGAKSVVMALWNANGEATTTLMTEFYKNLFQGKKKAEALREAQLYYLQNVEEDPDLWATWILEGDPGAIPLVSKKESEADITNYRITLN